MEAELAYDEAANREAIRMHTIPERMPPRRMRIRPCGRHYTIEVGNWSPVRKFGAILLCTVRSFSH